MLVSALLLAGGTLACWSLLRRVRRGDVVLCPGPRRPLWWRLAAAHAPRVGGCWYDLRGLSSGADGRVTCPECGRKLLVPDEALHARSRWRPAPAATVLLAAGVAIVATDELRSGRWVQRVPMPALVAMESMWGSTQPVPTRDEIERRVAARSVGDWSARRLARTLTTDLRDDAISGNAQRASRLLAGLGDPAIAPLERALAAGDQQERRLAAMTLATMEGYQPSQRFAAVLIEMLGSGEEEWVSHRAWRVLRRTGDVSRGPLEAALDDADRRRRQLAAIALCRLGPDARSARVLGLAVEALRDDRIRWNSTEAQRAILLAGPDVVPALEAALGTDDDQQLRKVMALLAGTAGYEPSPELLALAAAQLRSDHRSHNARFWGDRLVTWGARSRPALLAALGSDDRQLRQLAASALLRIDDGDVPDEMLPVLVEGLRGDALGPPGGRRGWDASSRRWHAGQMLAALRSAGDRAAPLLATGIDGDDPQQRVLCASLAGLGRIEELRDRAVPVLIEHLGDNALPRDAHHAREGLLGYGPVVLPALRAALGTDDDQRREHLRSLIAELGAAGR